jgi:hypothetical protein
MFLIPATGSFMGIDIIFILACVKDLNIRGLQKSII